MLQEEEFNDDVAEEVELETEVNDDVAEEVELEPEVNDDVAEVSIPKDYERKKRVLSDDTHQELLEGMKADTRYKDAIEEIDDMLVRFEKKVHGDIAKVEEIVKTDFVGWAEKLLVWKQDVVKEITDRINDVDNALIAIEDKVKALSERTDAIATKVGAKKPVKQSNDGIKDI